MKTIKKFIIPIILLLIIILPAVSFAWKLGDPLVPSCTPNCKFEDLMTLVDNIMTFILVYMAVPIAAIMFAYAGFLMVTAGGETAHARTKAKEIFTDVVIGLIFAVAAFVIVKTILSILGYQAPWIGF